MVSPVLTDGARTGCYIVSEANNMRSREQGVLAAGNSLAAGTVIARITASKQLTALTIGATTGAQVAIGILYDNVTAGASPQRVVYSSRDMEANGHELVWPAGISDADKATAIGQLNALGIVLRT